MKAFIYTKYGQPEVLRLKELEKPVPKDNEVLVKINAVSINDWDWQLMLGIPFVNRMINGLLKPKLQILGSDIAGTVEAVGKNVKKFLPGDNVFGDLSGAGWGGFAEYVCTPENVLAPKLADMSFAEAASIPQAAMLAVQGLIDKGEIKPGTKLLINGAGGGVGTFAVQIAKLYGAEVTGVDRFDKLDMMRSLGFDHVIDYSKEDFSRNGKRYDLILDVKTNRPMRAYVRSLNHNGIYVTVGGDISRLFQAFIFSPIFSLFIKKHIRIVVLKVNKDLAYVKELFESGKLKPVIDAPFNFENLPEAMKYFGEGWHKGKVVIEIQHNN